MDIRFSSLYILRRINSCIFLGYGDFISDLMLVGCVGLVLDHGGGGAPLMATLCVIVVVAVQSVMRFCGGSGACWWF